MTLPSISIVIPNYQSGGTIGRAIASVLAQGYEHLQLVVIDGGSKDSSVDEIRKYEAGIDYWVSEPDRGQSDAINKGLQKCTGDVVNWLCSDDYLHPGCLQSVAAAFASGECDVVVGKGRQHFVGDDERELILSCDAPALERLPVSCPIPQQSCFFSRALLADRQPPLRPDLHFVMDIDLYWHFLRMGARWTFVDQIYGTFEMSSTNKSSQRSPRHVEELERVFCEQFEHCAWLAHSYRRWYVPVERRIESVRNDRIREFAWGFNWMLKSMVGKAVGCPQFRFTDWHWCAPLNS